MLMKILYLIFLHRVLYKRITSKESFVGFVNLDEGATRNKYGQHSLDTKSVMKTKHKSLIIATHKKT